MHVFPGVYPFAGREVARAFALSSLEISDCTGTVDDLKISEIDTLRDWIARFEMKYPIVGTVESVQQNTDSAQAEEPDVKQ